MPAPQHLFLHGSISKALLKLGAPIILINILQSAYQLTDALWLGRWQQAQLIKEDKDIAKVTHETLIEEGNH